jgi:hypothetical protein
MGSHPRLTNPSSNGESSRVETAVDGESDALTALTIWVTASDSAGSGITGVGAEASACASVALETSSGIDAADLYVGGFT